MFFWIIIIIFILLLIEEFWHFHGIKAKAASESAQLFKEKIRLEKAEKKLSNKMNSLETSMRERFLFYDTARKISPLLDRQRLFAVFSEELKYLGQIEDIRFTPPPENSGYLKFELGDDSKESLFIKTKAKSVIGYVPYFINLLRLCLSRAGLYDKLQELSIHDSLTNVYNRRYFMRRYLEEFERAGKFKLELSFLMIDIDYFKKINDSYGHLVGDAVLRETARLIKENIRDIDFIARYGGEEFSVILTETDKAGAIMVAERISSRISRERIKVFDENLNTSVSVGVATFPDNTIHSDVLIELADKAMYKAKVSGRNRVSWF